MDVVVFGSLNVDLVFRTVRLPDPGETVMGEDLSRFAGGKGANQAVASARMGAITAMIGSVGMDADGDWLLEGLVAEGVDVSRVRRVDAPTGAAGIFVDSEGRNQIVVSPGANRRLWATLDNDISPKVALAQNEVPLDSVVRFLGTTTAPWRIWNPAPAVALTGALKANANVIIPNEIEAGLLLRKPQLDPSEAATRLVTEGFEHVIVTVGKDGVIYANADGQIAYPAPEVIAVDTTAAGDVFCGALAAFLAQDYEMKDAIELSIRAASISVTRPGAQASIPSRAEVIRL